MNANELRINNFIQLYRKPGDQEKITHQIKSIYFDSFEELYFVELYDEFSCSMGGILPIELTEKWMLKFGFENKPENMYHGNGQDWKPDYPRTYQNDFFIPGLLVRFERWQYTSDGEICTDLNTYIYAVDNYYPNVSEYYVNCIEVKYVHQLQNLYFDLTGKEF